MERLGNSHFHCRSNSAVSMGWPGAIWTPENCDISTHCAPVQIFAMLRGFRQ